MAQSCSSFIIIWAGLRKVPAPSVNWQQIYDLYFMASHEQGNIACCGHSVTCTTTLSEHGSSQKQKTNKKKQQPKEKIPLKRNSQRPFPRGLVPRHRLCAPETPDLGARDPPAPPQAVVVCSLSTWPSPGFTWHLKTSNHSLFPNPTSQTAQSERDGKKAIPKKRRCRNNHSAVPAHPTQHYLKPLVLCDFICY